jgi:hypothetical protein
LPDKRYFIGAGFPAIEIVIVPVDTLFISDIFFAIPLAIRTGHILSLLALDGNRQLVLQFFKRHGAVFAKAILAPLTGALGAQVIAAVTADTFHAVNFPLVVHYPTATITGYFHHTSPFRMAFACSDTS